MNSIYSKSYQPHTYIIGWKSINVWYFGSETAKLTKIANPDNLWTTYFTSSNVVKNYRQTYGETTERI